MYCILNHEESLFLSSPSPDAPSSNRGRRSCAYVCDSEGEVQVMGERVQEEPGLGDVRSETWAGYVLRGILRPVGAFGSSLRRKTQKEGCPGCLLGVCFWVVLGAPG